MTDAVANARKAAEASLGTLNKALDQRIERKMAEQPDADLKDDGCDREETIDRNPKSWIAWKREADRLRQELADRGQRIEALEAGLQQIADEDWIYDPGSYMPEKGREGPFAQIARSLLSTKPGGDNYLRVGRGDRSNLGVSLHELFADHRLTDAEREALVHHLANLEAALQPAERPDDLRAEVERLREHIRRQAEDIMSLGRLVYAPGEPPVAWCDVALKDGIARNVAEAEADRLRAERDEFKASNALKGKALAPAHFDALIRSLLDKPGGKWWNWTRRR